MFKSIRSRFYRSALYPIYFRAVREAQAARWNLGEWLRARSGRRSSMTAHDGTPLPGPQLMNAVAGTSDVEWFLTSGALGAQSIEAILSRAGLAMAEFSRVLDFGCGVGRVMRHWAKVTGPELHGTDYNPALIQWCQVNLRFARFQVNPLVGQLPYADSYFDFIYALSVFTHLTEPQQDFWMKELRRLLVPGGHLLISTHGDFYASQIPAEAQPVYQRGERLVFGGEHAGTNICAAYHPAASVRNQLAAPFGFEVVAFEPEGALGNPRQDYWLLKKAG
jgi:SAM-dependent methyltransferase